MLYPVLATCLPATLSQHVGRHAAQQARGRTAGHRPAIDMQCSVGNVGSHCLLNRIPY
jgi:hypothetical protein